jgi:hypothetical protein
LLLCTQPAKDLSFAAKKQPKTSCLETGISTGTESFLLMKNYNKKAEPKK